MEQCLKKFLSFQLIPDILLNQTTDQSSNCLLDNLVQVLSYPILKDYKIVNHIFLQPHLGICIAQDLIIQYDVHKSCTNAKIIKKKKFAKINCKSSDRSAYLIILLYQKENLP